MDTLGYNVAGNDITANSDVMKELAYHELSHAAHFNRVGNDWWATFVSAEVTEMLISSNPPYGYGNNGATSDIIGLAESWGFHMGHFLTNLKYGMSSAPSYFQKTWFYNNSPVNGLSSHLNLLEAFNPNKSDDPDRWIPTGLYYDLFDNRNDVPNPITDEAGGYTNQQFFNALEPDVNSMLQFKSRFLQQVGSSTAVTNLFNEYHY